MSLRNTLIVGTIAGTALASLSASAAQELKINAGPNQTIRFGESASVAGTASKEASIGWSKVEGPGAVTFEKQHSPVTTVTFDAPGEYTLMLGGFDGYVAYDTVRIIVSP